MNEALSVGGLLQQAMVSGQAQAIMIDPPRKDADRCLGLQPALDAEFALLAACARWPDGADRRGAIDAALAQPLDWERVLALVRRHRIAPLVEHGLATAACTPPKTVAEPLRKEAKAAAWREFLLAGELARVAKGLASAQVRPRVLKGVTVSLAAYGRLGLRYNRDIDLLVRRDEVPACGEILATLGYQRIEPPADAGAGEVRRWMRSHKDLVFRHPAGAVLELHWRLFDNPHLLAHAHKLPSVRLTLPERSEVDVFAPDIALIYLCMHGAQHAWSRLKWLADVNALLQPLGGDEVASLHASAEALGGGRSFSQAALLCHRLFDLPLPDAILAARRDDRGLRMLERFAWRALVGSGTAELAETRLGSTMTSLSHYLLATGWRYRLAEAWFDITDVSGSDIPRALQRLGPLARPAVWISRHHRWRRALPPPS